jgi:hypothetical protein
MLNVLEKFYSDVCGSKKKEGFQPGDMMGQGMQPTTWSSLPMILALVTVLILQLLIGKWLWNNYLVKAFTVVNPLKSAIDVLALSLLARLILG